ncbi:argininosuccinate synthase [Candidatus Peregrinibacteria bacterium]|nr:argininosuccinate synthase [Candidatus Peregrinibacteria bacterium]
MEKPYQKVASYEAKPGQVKKVVLLYSGGLDTSVMLKWIKDEYKCEVIALTIDLGQMADDLVFAQKKALKLGAMEAIIVDAKEEFAKNYITPAIKANASYQGDYHMATCIGRPLLAKLAVETAKKFGADAIAHGCTGKGNDQVRIEAGILTLDPSMKIIAPVREWALGRDEEIAYAKEHNIPVPHTLDKPYSYDDNMWGISAEGGEIEDPTLVPPLNKILAFCKTPEQTPDKSQMIDIGFEKGVPVSIDGKKMPLTKLIFELNKIGAAHGVGVHIHIENRLVGLKIRDIYEAPAGHMLIKSHKVLEKIVSTREENFEKSRIDENWAYLCYGAKWYEPVMQHLNAFTESMNQKVTGTVTLKLFKGQAVVMAVKSPYSLFNANLATFMKSSGFNQNASPGFIEIFSLESKMAYQMQRIKKAQPLTSTYGSNLEHDRPKTAPASAKIHSRQRLPA